MKSGELRHDVVGDACRLVRQMCPSMPIAELWDYEFRLRELWGGQRVYVKTAATVQREAAAAAANPGPPRGERKRRVG